MATSNEERMTAQEVAALSSLLQFCRLVAQPLPRRSRLRRELFEYSDTLAHKVRTNGARRSLEAVKA
jgi:hypothetical protein